MQKTYPLDLGSISDLADALCELDSPLAPLEVKRLVDRGHRALIQALDNDAHLVYGVEEAQPSAPIDLHRLHLGGELLATVLRGACELTPDHPLREAALSALDVWDDASIRVRMAMTPCAT